jgi:hypothetical protein
VHFNTGFNTGIPVLARPNTEIPVLEKAGGIAIPNSGHTNPEIPGLESHSGMGKLSLKWTAAVRNHPQSPSPVRVVIDVLIAAMLHRHYKDGGGA